MHILHIWTIRDEEDCDESLGSVPLRAWWRDLDVPRLYTSERIRTSMGGKHWGVIPSPHHGDSRRPAPTFTHKEIF